MDKFVGLAGESAARLPNERGYQGIPRVDELTRRALDILSYCSGCEVGGSEVKQVQQLDGAATASEEVEVTAGRLLSCSGGLVTLLIGARYAPDASVGRLWFEECYSGKLTPPSRKKKKLNDRLPR